MNRRSLLITESEKSRILNMHKTMFEIQKNFIHEEALNGQVVQGAGGDPYQYKGEGGKVFYAKKGDTSNGGQPKWIEQTKPEGVKAIQDKILNVAQPDKSTQVTQPTLELKPKSATEVASSLSTTSSGATQLQGLASGSTTPQLASRQELRQQRQDANQAARQQQRADNKADRQQQRADNQAARQQKRATKEQEQQCNTWFKNLNKFKATMKPEQLKQYQDTLNGKPCCEVIPADQMKAAGLTSCAAQPAPMATPLPPASNPTMSGAPTIPPTNVA